MIGQDWIVIFMTVRWRGGESKKRMGGSSKYGYERDDSAGHTDD